MDVNIAKYDWLHFDSSLPSSTSKPLSYSNQYAVLTNMSGVVYKLFVVDWDWLTVSDLAINDQLATVRASVVTTIVKSVTFHCYETQSIITLSKP